MNQHEDRTPGSESLEFEGPLDPDTQRFEDVFGLALQQVDPPLGFAERTLARTAAPIASTVPTTARVLTMPARNRWAAGAIAATLLAGVFAAEQVHITREQKRAEAAARQFQTAVNITASTLQDVRQQLLQEGVPLGR